MSLRSYSVGFGESEYQSIFKRRGLHKGLSMQDVVHPSYLCTFPYCSLWNISALVTFLIAGKHAEERDFFGMKQLVTSCWHLGRRELSLDRLS